MGKQCRWNRFVLVLVVFAMFGFAQGVNAVDCPDPLPSLITGPVDPTTPVSNGFPQWIMDQTGLALQICLEAANCFFDPPEEGNTFSEAIGFGPEAFWWMADSTMDLVGGGGALLVLAAEAAWAAEDPIDGDQFPFTRLRIRIDPPQAGTYTVTHPYGVLEFEVVNDTVGDPIPINTTIDIPIPAPTFGVLHASRIGNFLQSLAEVPQDPPLPPLPPEYIGDQRETTVKGSTCGADPADPAFNKFRIDASSGGFDIDLDPADGIQGFIETTIFTPQGLKYPRTPTIVDSSTYSRIRSGQGQIDVFARSLASATLTVDLSSPMTEDTSGGIFNNFFVHIQVPDLTTLPPTVSVAALPPAANPYEYELETIISNLDDIVTIARAVYDPVAQELTIMASSSDKYSTLAQPLPELTATYLGPDGMPIVLGSPFTNGSMTAAAGPVPPTTVTVASSKGGSDTADVIVVSNLDGGVCEGDLNGDGDQDGLDLDMFSLDYGRGDCP